MQIAIPRFYAPIIALVTGLFPAAAQASPDDPVGFSLTTHITQPVKAGKPGEMESRDEVLQLWQGRVAIRVVTVENLRTHKEMPLEMKIARAPVDSLWQAAIAARAVEIKSIRSAPASLWEDSSQWQQAADWWGASGRSRKLVRSVDELPIEFVTLEDGIQKQIATDGIDAHEIYPSRSFVAVRWIAAPDSADEKKFNTPDADLLAWLTDRTATTPELVYQIAKRQDLPASVGNLPDGIVRCGFRLGSPRKIVLELFNLP